MLDSGAIKIVNQLFVEMLAISPAFKQTWPTEHLYKATKRQWVLAFEDAGIHSFEEIKAGIRRLRLNSKPFVPSPGEFISMCRTLPEDVGAPTAREAYKEALTKSGASYLEAGKDKGWSHPAVKLAAASIGSHDISHKLEHEVFGRFEEVYLDLCSEFGSGKNMERIEMSKPDSVSEITGL